MSAVRARILLRRIVGLFWLLLLIVALVAVWPARFGGSASFVVVQGESMEPTYHTGDLIYARSVDDVEVGDIAVYRDESPVGGEVLVIHRIIEQLDDGRFVFQGDNRDQPDGTRPSADRIVARPVVNLGPIPTALLLRLPLLLALLVGATMVWWLWPRRDELAEDEPAEEQGATPIDRVSELVASAAERPIGEARPYPLFATITSRWSPSVGTTRRVAEPVGSSSAEVTRRAPTIRCCEGANTMPTEVTSRTAVAVSAAERPPVAMTTTSTSRMRAATSPSTRSAAGEPSTTSTLTPELVSAGQ